MSSEPSNAKNWKKQQRTQRALVMQGGGSLGAYEAGAYSVLYEKLSKETDDNENIFDVIAGTSIGAINAAIIVSHVVQNKRNNPSWNTLKCWEGSAEKLNKFWLGCPKIDVSEKVASWNILHQDDKHAASAEAARRYFSVQALLSSGAERFFTSEKTFPILDEKFFDHFYNSWYRQSNQPMKDTILGNIGSDDGFVKFPLKTNPEDDEPRLLIVSVDVEGGRTVTFDSYSPSTDYGSFDPTSGKYEYSINHPQGLMIEHLMASASVPLMYDFQWVPKDYDYSNALGEVQNPTPANSTRFWDGGLLSNTPTRELINQHQLLWEKTTVLKPGEPTIFQMRIDRDGKNRIEYQQQLFDLLWQDILPDGALSPNSRLIIDDMDIFIVDLWPTTQENPPYGYDDFDLTKNAAFNIAGHDKTSYDLKVAAFVTDHIDLILMLISQLAKSGDANKVAARDMLLREIVPKMTTREGTPMKYIDLIIGRFGVNEKLRIERTEDPSTVISSKWIDVTNETVKSLMEQGRSETRHAIARKDETG